jgi:hypothetical protein
MKSLRQIEREYNRMMLSYKDPVEPNKVNVYTCANNHAIKTIDIDNGTTPMLLTCAICQADAKSTWYKDTRPDIEVSHEFYRPDLIFTMKKLRKNPNMLEHVLAGGLMIRKITKQPVPKNTESDTKHRGIVLKK